MDVSAQDAFVDEVYGGSHHTSLDAILNNPLSDDFAIKNADKFFGALVPQIKAVLTAHQLGVASSVTADLSKPDASQHFLELLRAESLVVDGNLHRFTPGSFFVVNHLSDAPSPPHNWFAIQSYRKFLVLGARA